MKCCSRNTNQIVTEMHDRLCINKQVLLMGYITFILFQLPAIEVEKRFGILCKARHLKEFDDDEVAKV